MARRSSTAKRALGLLAGMGMGVVLGIVLTRLIDFDAIKQMNPLEFALFYGLIIAMAAVALLLQIAIHEAGHLVCGLMSGYTFLSYRVGSLVVLKKDGRLSLKHLSMPGTAGQCIMVPPGEPGSEFPAILYNLGGVIANLIAAAICACLLPVAGQNRVAAVFLGSMVALGVMLALANGIPMHGGAVPNDGWNALNLGKDSLARRSFWVQLAVNGRLSEGMRVKDMPDEWFELPPDDRMGETFAASLAVFVENRLVDMHEFEAAEELAGRLLADDAGTVDLHRALLACDRAFCRLMLGRDAHEEELAEKETALLLKQLANNPSVLRTRYALELLAHDDREAAQCVRESFNKVARTYPTETDIAAERELMALADARFCR